MKVGILTSGGDSPGMNAVIRSVTRNLIYNNYVPVGIYKGYSGLINNEMNDLSSLDVSDIIFKGGTFLKSSRCLEFMESSGVDKAVENIRKNNLEYIIIIGGDGSFKGAYELQKRGIKVACIPATIDNDMAYTQDTVGFNTAIETVVSAITKLRDTTSSHERICVVEVMGRNCGDLSLYSGVACGVEEIIIPERKYDMNELYEDIERQFKKGKDQYIISYSEGCGNVKEFVNEIEKKSDHKVTLSILGHIQRGGMPSGYDRLLGTMFGKAAVDGIIEGKDAFAVGNIGLEILDFDLITAINTKERVNKSITKDIYGINKILKN